MYGVFLGDQLVRVVAMAGVVSILAHSELPVTLFTFWVLVIGAALALGATYPRAAWFGGLA